MQHVGELSNWVDIIIYNDLKKCWVKICFDFSQIFGMGRTGKTKVLADR